MNSHRPLAFGVSENVDAVVRVGVHRRHDPSRIVCADWNQAEIERAAELADLLESWTDGQVGVFLAIVEFVLGQLGDCPVAGVASEVDFLAARSDAPAGPESVAFVEGCACTRVLARKAS
jgi:hypothetical protein